MRWFGLLSSSVILVIAIHSHDKGSILSGISAGLLFAMCAITLIFPEKEVTNMNIGEIVKEVEFEPIPDDVPVPEIVPEPVPEKETVDA